MGNELENTDYYEQQAKVVDLHLRYSKSPAQIAKSLGLKPAVVRQHLAEFQSYANNNADLQERARELVLGADKHFGTLIERTTETIEDIDKSGIPNTIKPSEEVAFINAKLKAISTIRELEMSRIKVMQETGLLDDEQAASERLETERKVQAIKDILLEVTSKCDHCRVETAKRISELENEAVIVE